MVCILLSMDKGFLHSMWIVFFYVQKGVVFFFRVTNHIPPLALNGHSLRPLFLTKYIWRTIFVSCHSAGKNKTPEYMYARSCIIWVVMSWQSQPIRNESWSMICCHQIMITCNETPIELFYNHEQGWCIGGEGGHSQGSEKDWGGTF